MNKPFASAGEGEASAGFKADEFHRMIERGAFDGMSVELIGQRWTRLAPAHLPHAALHARLTTQRAMASGPEGLLVATDLALTLDESTVVGVAIAVLTAAREPAKHPSGGDVVLAVEIAHARVARDPRLQSEGLCTLRGAALLGCRRRRSHRPRDERRIR